MIIATYRERYGRDVPAARLFVQGFAFNKAAESQKSDFPGVTQISCFLITADTKKQRGLAALIIASTSPKHVPHAARKHGLIAFNS